jgi:Ca2+-binding RTX toxin-like protein
LIVDANDNLFGTTSTGGIGSSSGASFGYGQIFELPKGAASIQTLAWFDGTNGVGGAPLVMDGSGDLYGECTTAGTYGLIYALGGTYTQARSNTIQIYATLDGTNGKDPVGGLAINSSGTLYGIAQFGGPDGEGDVFAVQGLTQTIVPRATVSGRTLVIMGTLDADTISAAIVGDDVSTTINGQANGPFFRGAIDSIEVHGEYDNDMVDLSQVGTMPCLIDGGKGADTLIGGMGADSIDGGEGADSILGGAANDTLVGGPGSDTLEGGAGADSIVGNGGINSLRGGNGNDTITGGNGHNTIVGNEGNDSLEPGAGVATLRGGTGDDTIRGAGAFGQIFAGAGNNIVYGTNYLTGQSGCTIQCGNGHDAIYAAAPMDVIQDQTGSDTVHGP